MALLVLVADAHPVFREGLYQLLDAQGDMTVVGRARSADEAVSTAGTLRPDVVAIGFDTDRDSGSDAVRRILRCAPGIAVLVLATSGGDESVFAALRAGARGYLLRSAEASHIVRAVRTVASGEALLDASVAARLAGYFSATPDGAAQAFPILTRAEREVLVLIASGLTNGEIARRLFVSPKTVRNRVSSIFNKLHVPNRARAILLARSAGLGGPMTPAVSVERAVRTLSGSVPSKRDCAPVTPGHRPEDVHRYEYHHPSRKESPDAR
jgi:DNA-binding NarL/FixJ family response regulator